MSDTTLAAKALTTCELSSSMKLMLFTDTLGDVNGVSRFIRNMGEQAALSGRELHIVTSTRFEVPDHLYIHNVAPLFARTMPGYESLELVLPPLVRLLRLAGRLQPDVVHVSTPGPVGLVGVIAARMLRAPVAGVYHTDFPAYVDHLFEDAVYTRLCDEYMKLFYSGFGAIFTRSAEYIDALVGLGMPRDRMLRLRPGVALGSFSPDRRDASYWESVAGVSSGSVKALYVGRVSVEKNLPLLAKAWPAVRRAALSSGREAELLVVGEGPYLQRMARELAGHGAHFLGFKHGEELSKIYASSDLFVFPSLTVTLGQVVLEAQASGLPTLVSDRGGPKDIVAESITGDILPGEAPEPWTGAMTRLILDDDARTRMGRSAHTKAQGFTIEGSFEHWWRTQVELWARRRRLGRRALTARPDGAPRTDRSRVGGE